MTVHFNPLQSFFLMMFLPKFNRNLAKRISIKNTVLLMIVSIVIDCRIEKSHELFISTKNHRKTIAIKFNCTNRPVGYYADLDFDCRIFHICDNFGRRIPFKCPRQTMFNQIYRVCDWESNVNCSTSPDWYHLNHIITI
ncbi:hypothetical protein SSS_06229 [Sarcoptes scabiei]|uniref:Chitin-binding type-2 domain-containing protein n=1 Tax=Sarcoptes scabiei TaxID=52283 RepID=A0A834RBP3_SARSC|nr:hypothetical protein SSS_06229 [Sarcoptes scabiei]